MAKPLPFIVCLFLGLMATLEAGFPRLHFSGQFLADTETLNNDPFNFNIDNFNPNRDPPCYPNYTFPHCNWNPPGSGDFRFVNCTVTKVCYRSGKCTTNDPIVGKRITGSDDTVAAKMVDLDPYYQMYTAQLYGLLVGVEGAFQGKFKTNTVMDIWQRCKEDKCLGDPGSSGYWRSVLESVTWSDGACTKEAVSKTDGAPTFIEQLKCSAGAAGTSPAETLNIKFTVDMMNEDPRTPNFAHGRVVGSISSVDTDEHADHPGIPEFNRRLWGQGVISALVGQQKLPEMKDYYDAPFYFDRKEKKVVVDLSNSLPTSLDGKLIDRGNLFLLVVHNKSSLEMENGYIKNCGDILNNPGINVGPIDYTADEWLWQDAGIVILDMVMDMELLPFSQSPVVMVVKEEPPPCQQCQKQCLPVLVEHPEGLYIGAAEDYVFRIPEPETTGKRSLVGEDQDENVFWSLKIFATKFGSPAKDVEFIVQPSDRTDIGKPEDAITLVYDSGASQQSYITDGQGIAVVNFKTDKEGLDCNNPGVANRRAQQVDGQLYVYMMSVPGYGVSFPPKLLTTTHLYCKLETTGDPTWVDDIYPIFQRYDNLFPVMKPLFNLASYKEVIKESTKTQLDISMRLPLEDPNHMPVTRDLSPAKRDMILSWLESGVKYESSRETELDALKANLQIAMRLEWTTIPPYLSSYYSIKDGFNTKVASLIKSIVVEEMQHMTLVANILNALGWEPILNNPDVVPTYPGPLPGGCRPDITAQLGKCSLHQIHDVFMAIEQPACSGDIVDTINLLHKTSVPPSSMATFASGHTVASGLPMACANMPDKNECGEDEIDALIQKCNEPIEDYQPDTIGALYIHKILCPMADLYNKGVLDFSGDPTKQVPWPFCVTDMCSAALAIKQIVDQGEGGDPCNPFYTGQRGKSDLSHYYKFAEIAHGRGLVKVSAKFSVYQQDQRHHAERERMVCEKDEPDFFTPCGGDICCDKPKYEYAGAPIPFFQNAVWPTLPNPSSSKYPSGSRARKMSDRFNEKYTSLINCLHDVFNRNPSNIQKCLGLMSSLTTDAKKMVRTPIDPDGDPDIGPNVAPTFEWYPPIDG